jgi:hypothetical protein
MMMMMMVMMMMMMMMLVIALLFFRCLPDGCLPFVCGDAHIHGRLSSYRGAWERILPRNRFDYFRSRILKQPG